MEFTRGKGSHDLMSAHDWITLAVGTLGFGIVVLGACIINEKNALKRQFRRDMNSRRCNHCGQIMPSKHGEEERHAS